MADLLLDMIHGVIKGALADTNLTTEVSVEIDYSHFCLMLKLRNWKSFCLERDNPLVDVNSRSPKDYQHDVQLVLDSQMSDDIKDDVKDEYPHYPDLTQRDIPLPPTNIAGFTTLGYDVKPDVCDDGNGSGNLDCAIASGVAEGSGTDDLPLTGNELLGDNDDCPKEKNSLFKKRNGRISRKGKNCKVSNSLSLKRKRARQKLIKSAASTEIIKQKKQPLECEVCGFLARGKKKLERHATTHSTDRPYSCSLCDRRFKREDSKRTHMAAHMGVKPFKCELCDYECNNKTSLRTHITVTHSNAKPFSCELCEFSTKTKVRLAKHVSAMHSKPQLIKCALCNHETLSEYRHRLHMQAHEQNLSYTCQICNKIFMIEKDFQLHVARHNGLKNNKVRVSCPDCGQEFIAKESLRSHMYIHTGEMHYKCRICGTQFRRYHSMIKHFRKIHPNEAVFYCGACDFPTDKKPLFERHVTTAAHREKQNLRESFMARSNPLFSPNMCTGASPLALVVPIPVTKA